MAENLVNGTGNHLATGETDSSDMNVFFRSVMLVGVAELFDKTWFMGLLLALAHDPTIVFVGSFSALFLHTILAAAMGYAFARFLSPVMLNFLTAALFFVFFFLYLKDFYYADPNSDAIQAGKDEAAEDGTLLQGEGVSEEGSSAVKEADGKQGYNHLNSEEDTSATDESEDVKQDSREAVPAVLWKSFLGVFIAEWGDRTQIAMISQHASQPLIPVFLGSTVAFFLLTGSAVMAAFFLRDCKLSQRVVFGVSALCFLFFALLALKDALESLHAQDDKLASKED